MRQLLYKDNIVRRSDQLRYVSLNEIEEKLKKKYGTYKLGRSIYISNNDNLVISDTIIDVVATDEEYKEAVRKYIECIKRAETPYEKLIVSKSTCPKAFLTLKDVHESELKLVTKKFIITRDGRLYYTNGKKIYRLAFKTQKQIETLEEILNDFILINSISLPNHFTLINSYFKNIFPIFESANNISDWRSCIIFLATSPSKEAFYMSLSDYPKFFRKKFSCQNIGYRALTVYHQCKAMGFNDNNVIAKLAFDNNVDLLSAKWIKHYLKDVRKEYKDDKDINAEVVVANRITSEVKDVWLLRDSLNMYYFHKREMIDFKAEPFRPDFFRKTLVYNHNYLSALVREDNALRDKREYPYDESYNKFIRQVEDYSFMLPKNSVELVRLANVMSNCVAGYSSKILYKQSIIVYATNSDIIKNYIENGENDDANLFDAIKDGIKSDKLKEPLCIELSPLSLSEQKEHVRQWQERQIVRQCYTVSNHIPSEETGRIAKKYFDAIGYDYSNNIINNRLNGRYFDYDEMGLPF